MVRGLFLPQKVAYHGLVPTVYGVTGGAGLTVFGRTFNFI